MNQNNINYISRYQETTLKHLLNIFPAVLIEGAKSTGKSTIGERFANSTLFLQDPNQSKKYLQLAELNPSILLEGEKPRLIDEWQMAPVLWDAIRFESDRSGGNPGAYILTDSAVPRDNTTMHTGTGRFARMHIRPMSLSESGESSNDISLRNCFNGELDIVGQSTLSLEDIAAITVRGGWPLVVRNKIEGSSFVRGYIREIAEQDASRVDGIEKDPAKLMLFMRSLARATATTTALRNIKADIFANNGTISDETLYSYHKALKRIFVIEDLPAWSTKLRSKTTIRSSDVHHFTDPSISAALLGAGPGDLLQDPETFGFLFESLVIRDLRVYAEAIGGSVAHYRDSNGLEADAIIHFPNGAWAAVEVKLGIAWADKAASSLLKLSEIAEKKPEFLMVIVPDGYAYRRKDGVLVCPIGCLCP